ncbi:MAG: hypothetical protein JSV44_01475 [Candidatus Zixiibacteriota bacterium]|nr:MAG: hypothetical protein JSV44_01475 [candidate division Zixibacteria bacterium]
MLKDNLNPPNKATRGHGIALFSGGLDSSLAILLVLRQDIKVTALTFLTHFGCEIIDQSNCSHDPYPAAAKFGFSVRLVHLGESLIDIVKSPKYGHGRNMNPCVDCRILMLREAKRYMELVGADFVFTGEVLAQRPKSQFRDMLNVVERDSGLKGYLVRPLSARLLPETIPEATGLLDRSRLENIAGRSRRRQIELANTFGLTEYPSPTAGCLLTDSSYSNRLRDLLDYTDAIDFRDLNLLKVGRHFRLDKYTKLVVGRHEEENRKIKANAKINHLMLEVLGVGSPIALYISSRGEQRLAEAAAITARYSDAKYRDKVEVTCVNDCDGRKWVVSPADPEEISQYLIR